MDADTRYDPPRSTFTPYPPYDAPPAGSNTQQQPYHYSAREETQSTDDLDKTPLTHAAYPPAQVLYDPPMGAADPQAALPPVIPERDKRKRAKVKRFWHGDKDPTLTDAYPASWTEEDIRAEKEYLASGMFDWKELSSWRFWIRKEWWYWYVLAIVLAVLVTLMTVYHDQIVDWLTPVANWMKNVPAGWTIPIAVLFVLSFPPLFGAEIVCILCGVVWGLWIGFGIVAAGTFAGEVGNYVAFKYWCRSRADKYERQNVNYGCLAHVMREGGFWIVFLARLSAIPGHFTTAVFATCGMNIWIFLVATLLTLPKQLIIVYLGVLFQNKDKSNKDKIISYTVLAVGFLITIWAAWYIYREMAKARIHVWRKARMQAAAKAAGESDTELGHMRIVDRELASAPILTKPAAPASDDPYDPYDPYNRESAYANPYDIKYARENGMSVYRVDDGMSERVHLEEDIASRWPQGAPAPSPRRSRQSHDQQRGSQAQRQSYDRGRHSYDQGRYGQQGGGHDRQAGPPSAFTPVSASAYDRQTEPGQTAFPTPHPTYLPPVQEASRFTQV